MQYGFFMPCQSIDFTFLWQFEKKNFFFEKKVGPTNVCGLFFYTEGFRSTLSMLWRIKEYVMYQVFMQISRYLCQIWLIVRWGPSSPPALAFWSKSRIRLYLPPLYRPLPIGFFQKKFEILRGGKVLTFGCQTGIEVEPKILFLIFYFFFIFSLSSILNTWEDARKRFTSLKHL